MCTLEVWLYGGWTVRSIQIGANAWRKVEGVMYDRQANLEKAKRENVESRCHIGMPMWPGDSA